MYENKQEFSQLLRIIAELLDIPDSKYEEAVAKYEAVGKWLDGKDSTLSVYKPVIYPQGSFRLGTMIKPIGNGDEYDIDLVCRLEIEKEYITQKQLKQMVGDRLRENKVYKDMLREGRRCWILDYANEFHMDILPAIPDYKKLNDAILITDKKLYNWQHSNPKGYALWFAEQMKTVFLERKLAYAKSIKANVEEVPDYKIKTPLQRSIQLLKRHRDVYFGRKDDKPISIIITTLAARFYKNESDLFEAITNIANRMSDVRYLKNPDGMYYIPNPVNPDENFADKWNEDPQLPQAFFEWLGQLQDDFSRASNKSDIYKIAESLSPSLGAGIVDRSLKIYKSENCIQEKTYPEVIFAAKPAKSWAR